MAGQPITISNEMISALCPHRPENGHKGTFGRLLVYAGGPSMGGAACMAAASALRSGVGLVYALTTPEVAAALLIRCPEVMATAVPQQEPASRTSDVLQPMIAIRKVSDDSWAEEAISGKDAVLAGPGIDPSRKDLRTFLYASIQKAPHLALDAGSLSLLSEEADLLQLVRARYEKDMAPVVMTPHLGEFQRLLPSWQPGDLETAGAWAQQHGVVLILKSNETNIFTPDGKWYSNPVHNSGLAKGGSGDVLSGLLGGLLATGMKEEDAAVCAVGIHSLAGKICAKKYGKRAMLPSMLWEEYPACFATLKWEEGMQNDG